MTKTIKEKPTTRTDNLMGASFLIGAMLFIGGVIWAASLIHPALGGVTAGLFLMAITLIYIWRQV